MKNKLLKILSIFALLISISACTNNENSNSNDISNQKSQMSLDELNITYVTQPLNVPSIVEKNKKILQKHLPGVKINYKEITSGADQTTALASGDVDILYGLGGSSAILAKANGQNLKVIDMYSRAPEAFSIFSKDNSINDQYSLVGKTIAGPVGTNLHQLLLAYLDLYAMNESQVNYVDMSIPDSLAGLESGSVDVALIGGPAAYKAKEAGYNEITNGKGYIDALICAASSDDFIKNHPDVINAFKDAQAEIAKFMKDNPDETRDIVKKELDIDDKAYDYMYPMYDFSTEIGENDKSGFKRTMSFMKRAGMIENDFDINELF